MSSSTDTSRAAIYGDGATRAAGPDGVGVVGGVSPGAVIEDVAELARLREIEEVQVLAWGMEERGIVRAALLQIATTGGGILLAAYDRAGRGGGWVVGFVFGLLARRDGRLYHASHMLATDPGYQGRGVGAALKLAQRTGTWRATSRTTRICSCPTPSARGMRRRNPSGAPRVQSLRLPLHGNIRRLRSGICRGVWHTPEASRRGRIPLRTR